MYDALECPITFEPFDEKGDQQPLMLPNCGHAFSRVAVQGLLDAQKGKVAPGPPRKGRPAKPPPFNCPTCNTPQNKVQKIDDCPPNWAIIQRLHEVTAQDPAQKEAAERRKKQEDAARRKRAEEEHKQAEAERKLQAERLQRDREELERREAEAQAERAREQARLEEEEEKRREAKAARLAAEAEKAEALLKEKKRAAEQAKAEAEQKEKERQERQPKKQRAAAASFAAAADAAAAAVTAAVAPERSLAVPAAQEPSSHPLPELPSGATPKATPDQTRLKEVVGLSSGSTNEVVSYQVAPGPGAARLLRPPTQPTGPRTIPKLLLKNRGSQLSRTDALANRRALEAPLSVIVERAVAPVLTPEDSISVAKALSALVVKEANSTASVLEVATLRLPVLQHLASMWSNLPTTEYVESLDDVNNRSLKQLHGPLCDDYAKLMRMARSKVTPDIVLNSAPGALQLVQLRIAADLVDKVYAALMMCRGYDLEEGAESAEAEDGTVPEDSRIEKLEFELEEAVSARASDGTGKEGDNILMPGVLFQVATSVLMPRQRRHRVPDNAIPTILTEILQLKVNETLNPAYGAETATKHSPRVASFICEHAPSHDCVLALQGSSMEELPAVVEAALEYLMCTEPASFTGTFSEQLAAGAASTSSGTGTSTAVDASASSSSAGPSTSKHAAKKPTAPEPAGPGEAGEEDTAADKKKASKAGGIMRGFLGGRWAAPPAVTTATSASSVSGAPALPATGNNIDDDDESEDGDEESEEESENGVEPPSFAPLANVRRNARPRQLRSEEEDQEHEEEQSDADDDDEAGDESSDNDSLPALVDVPLPPTPPNAAAAAVAPAAPAAVPSAAKNCAASGSSAAAPAAAMASTSSASAAVPAPAVYETSYKMELEGWDDKSPFVPVDEFRGTRQKLPDHRNASRCEHFDRHGWCKVGEGCTLRHETGWSVTSNLSGLPIRRDKKVCKHYMINGTCMFGMACNLNHPNIRPASDTDASTEVLKGTPSFKHTVPIVLE